MLRVHRHDKELRDTQKINVSTEIKTYSCSCRVADLGPSTRVHLDKAAGQLFLLMLVYRERELISSVSRDPTQNISIYIQDRAERKVSSLSKQGSWMTILYKQHFRRGACVCGGGGLLSLASGKAGERDRAQREIRGPAC